MKIYTKSGDTGMTSLYGGKRISKSDLRIASYGSVDELNAYLGLLRDRLGIAFPIIKDIQECLFSIGAHLAADPDKTKLHKPEIYASDIEQLETQIDEYSADLEPLKHFVLPGGHENASFAHIARTICRRAEREVVALNEISKIPSIVIQYLNRLSDYLFVLSRVIIKKEGAAEYKWIPRK